MARQNRVKLAFVTDAAKRKAACKKRKTGLIKKMDELGTLCGVDVCAIIHCSELNPQLEFWPSKIDAERVIGRFKSLPRREQTKNMVDQQKFTRKCIAKANTKLQKLQTCNRQKELNKLMFDCLSRRSGLQNRGLEDLAALGRVVGQKLYDIEKRIESLRLNDPSQVGASTSNAGGAVRD